MEQTIIKFGNTEKKKKSLETLCTLQWRHNERNGVSNYWCLDCLPSRLFRRRSQKTPKLCATGLCEGNPPVTGGFPSQRSISRKMLSFDDVIMNINYENATSFGPCNTCWEPWFISSYPSVALRGCSKQTIIMPFLFFILHLQFTIHPFLFQFSSV